MGQRYERYLTFPIVIMKESLKDINNCISEAMAYCLYDNCQRSGCTPEQSANFFGIKYGNLQRSYKLGKTLDDSIPSKSPKTSINKEMMFDFLKNNKTEFEVVCFLAFAAIRSIIQRQPYAKITNDYLLGRMSGNAGKGADINPSLKKYTTRYQLDKIKTELQLKWGLQLYARQTRGFYVSFKMPLKDLIRQAELRRNKHKEKELRRKKTEILKEVLGELRPADTIPIHAVKRMVI